jgi:hypothetical protein
MKDEDAGQGVQVPYALDVAWRSPLEAGEQDAVVDEKQETVKPKGVVKTLAHHMARRCAGKAR